MESQDAIPPEVEEMHYQQALAAEAVQSYETLAEHDDHFLMLPDTVLGNRTGWDWTPAKAFQIMGRLEACRRALNAQGASIQGSMIVDVSVDVPLEDQTVRTQIERRAVLLLYKPSAEELERWRERTALSRLRSMP